MRRREFIGLVGGAVAWPLAAQTQQPERMRRIGVLMTHANESTGGARVQLAAFRAALSQRGWAEGQNLQIEVRWTGSRGDLIQKYAAELASQQPDAIITSSAPLLAGLIAATSKIPIVFYSVSAPIALGLVKDLARPMGNVTGFTGFEPSLGGKWVELMKELVPATVRVVIPFSPKGTPHAAQFMRFIEEATASKHMRCLPIELDEANVDFASLMQEHGREPNGSVILIPDAFTATRWGQYVPAAIRAQLPLMSPFSLAAQGGALASYGVNIIDQLRKVAGYVDRIMRGESAAELPVQEPTVFEFVINLKTAKALGLTVLPSLVARADEVIE
jgi:putative ABC transport system substrate-binding protein